MARTVTEVEVRKSTATNNHSIRGAAPASQEQLWRAKWLWIAAPLTLLTAGSAAFLVARRWLSSDESDGRRR